MRTAAAAPQGLLKIIQEIVKAEGGVAYLTKIMGDDQLTHWDKAEFYRGSGDEFLLERIVHDARPSVVTATLDKLFERFIRYKSGGGIEEGSAVLEMEGSNKIRLWFTAYGPTFHRYGSDEDIEEYTYEQDIPWGQHVEHSDEGDISHELRDFGKLLGGTINYGSPKQEESEIGGYYDYYRYDCWVVWQVSSEPLIRGSIGKWVEQAGQAAKWEGQPEEMRKGEFLVQPHDELVIERRRGDWPNELKRGLHLVVLRAARSNDKIRVIPKGQSGGLKDSLYFILRQDKKGLLLFDPHDRQSYLTVKRAP